MNTISMYCLEI